MYPLYSSRTDVIVETAYKYRVSMSKAGIIEEYELYKIVTSFNRIVTTYLLVLDCTINTNVKGSIVPILSCRSSELLKIEAVCLSETFDSTNKSMRLYYS